MNTAENPDLGTMLKNRRQECGLTVDEIANRTRIRRTYLLALEENRFQDLPGEAYIHGFLRNYAKALGLQQSAVLELYRGQQVDSDSTEDVRVPVEKKVSSEAKKKPRGLLPWLGVALLVIGAFSLIALQSFISKPEPLPPREPVAVIDTNPAPPPVLPAEESAATESGETAGAPAEGTPAAGAPASDSAAVTPPAVIPPTVAPQAPAVPGTATAPPTAAAPQEAAVHPGEEPLVFDFSGNGVVRLESTGANQIIFAGDNRLPQNYELTASAVLNWKVRQSARISFADPAAVKVWVDQRPLNLAGRDTILLERQASSPAEQ